MIQVEKLDYANGSMEGARLFEVYDGVSGARLFNVVEASAKDGWRVQIVTVGGLRRRGPDGKWLLKRIEGPVEVRRLVHVQDPAVAASKLDRAAAKRARQAARQGRGMVA